MRVGLLLTGLVNDTKTIKHLQKQIEYWNQSGIETEIYSTSWSDTHRYPWSTPTLKTDYGNPIQDTAVIDYAVSTLNPNRHLELLYCDLYDKFIEYCSQFNSNPYNKINRVAKSLRNCRFNKFGDITEFDDWWITYTWFTRFVYFVNQAYSLSQVINIALDQTNPPQVFLKWRWDLLCNYHRDTENLIHRLETMQRHEGYGIHFNRAWLFGEETKDIEIKATRMHEVWPYEDQPICVDDTWFIFNDMTANNLRKIMSKYLEVWNFDEPHQHLNLWSAIGKIQLQRGSYTTEPMSRILVRSGELIDDHFHRNTDRFFAQQQQNNQLASPMNKLMAKANDAEFKKYLYQAISSFDWSSQ